MVFLTNYTMQMGEKHTRVNDRTVHTDSAVLAPRQLLQLIDSVVLAPQADGLFISSGISDGVRRR